MKAIQFYVVNSEVIIVQINRSAIKRNKQNEKRRMRNKIVKSRIKKWSKKIRLAVDNNEIDNAKQIYKEFTSLVDRAVSKGIFHKNNAARKKSRLYRLLKRKEEK